MTSPSPSAATTTTRRALLLLLFAVYVVSLVWIVLWKLHPPYVGMAATRDIKLIPFLSGDGFGASAPPEVVANVLIFVPFGVYLGLLAPAWMWWKTASVLAGASLVLEIAEYVLAVGRSDISDVIANAAGGLVGLGILSLVRLAHRVRQRPI